MNVLFHCLILAGLAGASAPGGYFKITVVDDQTNRGVPLVELRTVNDVRYYSDSAGVVAFDEPGLMDQTVFFHVASHGYEFPKDGFGFRGVRLSVIPGGSTTIRIKRINIAERLYRVTGAGIYRDSQLVGDAAPISEPVLNGQVLGSDSVVNAVYRGKIYWFWGDTNRASYPLGNFHVPGATSKLPNRGGLDPNRGLDLEYFLDDEGFAKPTAKMPGDGPTWIDGLVALRDERGIERLFAKYVKVKPPLTVYERGLVEFNGDTEQFEHRARFDMAAPLVPGGHPFLHRDGGTEYVYFAEPYPLVRVKANADALQDLSQYEAYSWFQPGSRGDSPGLDRDSDGRLVLEWKRDTPAITQELQDKLIAAESLKPDEAYFRFRDKDGGKPVKPHRGSVSWNEFRKRWIMIFVEFFGRSNLGEVWYAEATSPVGPWTEAVRIVTHDGYSFYNPKQHPVFDQDGGRFIFFEGTYATTFSGNEDATPRYNYNQIMYRLDLADPRLAARE
jgi:hypothetical protein